MKQEAAANAGQVGKAITGIRAMRERLARKSELFRAAIDFEAEAERFCQEVRSNLRDLRVERKLDQSSLAKQLDLSQSAVSKIETSAGDIGIKTIFRYAHAVGLRPVCVFIPSAEQLIKETPQRRSGAQTTAVAMSPKAAVAFEEVQVKLVRSVSDSVSSVMNGLARAIDD